MSSKTNVISGDFGKRLKDKIPSASLRELFEQMGAELDRFFEEPRAYDRKKLEEMAVAFFSQLQVTLKGLGILETGPETDGVFVKAIRLLSRARRVLQSDIVDDYGCDPKFEMAIKPFFDFLFEKYFRVEADGLENIPANGRALLVSNHSGVLPYDAAMLKIAIYNQHPQKRELRFLVDDFVFHFPFLGVFMNRIGGVRASPENAERLLRHEEIIAVFPEGIKGISKAFSERYRLQRFGRGGVIKLALKTKSPILPVAVVGAEEIHPLLLKSRVLARPLGLPFIPFTATFPWLGPLGMIPLPTKWKIKFGPSFPLDLTNEDAIHDGVLINRENEKLRGTLQEMVDELLKSRRSIFFS